MSKTFKFTSIIYIKADDMDEAKEKFADESLDFAINAECKELYEGLFYIDGYYKDDKEEFYSFLVYAYDNNPEELPEGIDDDMIFYYGLSEKAIKDSMKNPDQSDLDFVITKYIAYE